MSRGLGRSERGAILDLIEDGDDYEIAYCAEDLALTIYGLLDEPGDTRLTRAQYLAALRAMHSLVQYPDRLVVVGGQGRKTLWLLRKGDEKWFDLGNS